MAENHDAFSCGQQSDIMKIINLLWIFASLFISTSGFGGPAGTPHYPDLVTLPPFNIAIEYNPGTGKKLLRFSNAVVNLGEGPLELNPVNNPVTGTTDAYQRLYSHDTDGIWSPVATNYVGKYVFHPAHNHWHFENFASYELHDVAADGSIGRNVFAAAGKVSFCLVDDVLLDPVQEHKGSQTYTNCSRFTPQGISVGWVDIYLWTLPDQDLDITLIPDGYYWVVSTADPAGVINEGGRSTEQNNAAATKVRIASDFVWVEDAVPEGADTGVSGGDSWKWISHSPAPFSGALAHQSALKTGLHQHYFRGATDPLAVSTNSVLFTYVFLDATNPPNELLLQWTDLTNSEHRAYWGTNGISLGTDGTASRYRMGPLPPAGQWVRLEVPANRVGLEGCTLRGMSFMLFDGRATWDYSGITVAPPSPGSAPPGLTTSTVPPIITSYSTSPFGISVELIDGTDRVKSDSIKITLDGAAVVPTINTTGAVTTIQYDATALLASGSGHIVKLEFADTATPSVTRSYPLDFVVPKYALVPPEFAAAPGTVDTAKPGFKIRPYQTAANNPDRLAWTEEQLAGLKGTNLANLTEADSNGYLVRDAVINFDMSTGAGNFPDDMPFPGLPGTGPRDGGKGNSATEVLTFLQFPKPGLYLMGVNSDDGFRVTFGPNALDKFAVKAGEFDGSRGPDDTLFRMLVPKAGFYPFRLIWESSSGSANLEWFAVDNGAKVLINDPNAADSIKAYREASTRPYVRSVSPLPDSVDVPGTNGISIVLANGTWAVQQDSIRLFLNAQPVQPAIRNADGITSVDYMPSTTFAPESTNAVRLIYSDNATPPNVTTNEFKFVVAPDFDLLIGIGPTYTWRYNQSGIDPGAGWNDANFDDSSWPSGAALFEGKNGTVPDLPEPVRTALTVGTNTTTYYFRTHFNFAGRPGGARLRLRHIIDDGAVFHLNGAEVYRTGMPAGPVGVSTFATRNVGNADYGGPVELPVRNLVAGDNVLAVEVHQVGSTSSDVTLGAGLVSITSNPLRTSVAAISPAPDALDVPRDSAIEIVLGDGTQTVQPGSIQLFVNGRSVSATISKPAGSPWTTILYRPDQMLEAETRVKVKLVFNDDATPPNATTREFSFTMAPVITVLVALDEHTTWRYDESGQDLGSAWTQRGFDDRSWKSGAALFEGKIGTVPDLPEPVRTTLTVDTNKTTFYFRTHFDFPGDPATVRLELKPIVDDGAVFYLNGTEVSRLGMPEETVTASTLATRPIGDAYYEGPFEIPAIGLAAGDNVLAVEVHQASATSSDVTFGAQLLVLGPAQNPPATFPKFISVAQAGPNLRIEWIGSGTLESSDAASGPWSVVTNASNPFTAPVDGVAKFFRLAQ